MYYYGHKITDEGVDVITIFRSDVRPTKESHGYKFSHVVGPFITKEGALESIRDYMRRTNLRVRVEEDYSNNPCEEDDDMYEENPCEEDDDMYEENPLRRYGSKARYKHIRVRSPKEFDPRSFRVIDPGRPGYTKLVIGCPKGKWDNRRKRCKVGTRVQAILRELERPGGKRLRRNVADNVPPDEWIGIFRELLDQGVEPRMAMKMAWVIYRKYW